MQRHDFVLPVYVQQLDIKSERGTLALTLILARARALALTRLRSGWAIASEACPGPPPRSVHLSLPLSLPLTLSLPLRLTVTMSARSRPSVMRLEMARRSCTRGSRLPKNVFHSIGVRSVVFRYL